jgi:hypothetical protein
MLNRTFFTVSFILFTITTMIFLSSGCKKQDAGTDISLIKDLTKQDQNIKNSSGSGVVNVDRLRFRADNDLHAKTLRYLDKGTIVSVISKDEIPVKIGEMEDYWFQIEYDGIKGWVFGYFLDLYQTYDDALAGSKKYLDPNFSAIKDDNNYFDEAINNNLFFLSEGKILQVTDGKKGVAIKLKTLPDLAITNYFISDNGNNIFYIGKQSANLRGNGMLFRYNLPTERNFLLVKDVYMADLHEKKNQMILLSEQTAAKDKYWTVKISPIDNTSKIREIVKIKKNKDIEPLENDNYTMSLERELGSLVKINISENGSFIYFKPPEEAQAYLISISNGTYIQVDPEQLESFSIDENQSIFVKSEENDQEKPGYNIFLKDKVSGLEKEIYRSELYPLNFSLSPRKNFVAISMIDLNNIKDKYYSTSIYVLSLNSFSMIPISTESSSYQPRWSLNQ